jgi:hypothetical protein
MVAAITPEPPASLQLLWQYNAYELTTPLQHSQYCEAMITQESAL